MICETDSDLYVGYCPCVPSHPTKTSECNPTQIQDIKPYHKYNFNVTEKKKKPYTLQR